MEPMSPTLPGGFLTIGLPGKSSTGIEGVHKIRKDKSPMCLEQRSPLRWRVEARSLSGCVTRSPPRSFGGPVVLQ